MHLELQTSHVSIEGTENNEPKCYKNLETGKVVYLNPGNLGKAKESMLAKRIRLLRSLVAGFLTLTDLQFQHVQISISMQERKPTHPEGILDPLANPKVEADPVAVFNPSVASSKPINQCIPQITISDPGHSISPGQVLAVLNWITTLRLRMTHKLSRKSLHLMKY